MTVGVYGLVAGIVKLDDAGLWLSRREGGGAAAQRALGRGLVRGAPWLMKALSVLGTAAMFLVGGSIISHGLPALHHLAEAVAAAVSQWPGIGAVLKPVSTLLIDGLVGVLSGAAAVAAFEVFTRVRGRLQRA
jgi:predicted DNA repair protein MutK